MTTFLADGNYYLHRSFHVVAFKRDPRQVKKNVLTQVVASIASDALHHKCTHVLVTFDASRSFRHEIYKEYKATRVKEKTITITLKDGSSFTTDVTPGSLVKPAMEVLALAGLATAQRKGYESDDLLGCAATSLPGRIIVGTRDKDMASLVNERVRLYWPKEKILHDSSGIRKHYGVEPHQIRDYLCLLGDNVDNIPGQPGFGPKTAQALLARFGSIAEALKDKKTGARLREHGKTLLLAKKLVTLKTDISFKLDDLVPRPVDPSLGEHIWSIPQSLKELGDSRKAARFKGLFNKG